MNSNSLKRSFPLEVKNEGGGDDCGCGQTKNKISEQAFDQSSGATRFLKEQSDPLSEGDDELPDEMKDQQYGSDDDEEEMEESRGAVEDVLRKLSGESAPQEQQVAEDRGAVEDVLRKLERDRNMQSETETTTQIQEDDPCWDGFTQVGMKTQDGEEVPNCVPDDEVPDAEGYQEESITTDEILDSVLEEQVDELTKLDRLADEILS